MQVRLDLQVMLRVAAHCTEHAPSIVTGELVGLETAPGVLEVTHCFQTPSRRDLWKPAEDKQLKEADKFRSNMRELLSYVDADCQAVGWYQTLTHTAFADPAAVEQLYQRTQEVDRASILLGFDIERNLAGQFPFRAFRLSPEYIALKRRQELGASSGNTGTGNAAGNAAGAGTGSGSPFPLQGDVLTELPVSAKSTVAVDCLLTQIPLDLSRRAAQDAQAQLNCAGQLERGLNYLAESIEEFTAESERLIKFQKDSSRFHQNLKRTIERKRNENEQRRADGEEALVIEEEAALSTFEKRAPDQLKSFMMSRQVSSVSTTVSALARLNVAASALIA